MSQLFFSLSVSMGIMITYGSYVKKDVNLGRSLGQIEFLTHLLPFGRVNDYSGRLCFLRNRRYGLQAEPDVYFASKGFCGNGKYRQSHWCGIFL